MEFLLLGFASLIALYAGCYGVVGSYNPTQAFYWFGHGWKYDNLEPSPQELWEVRTRAVTTLAGLGVALVVFVLALINAAAIAGALVLAALSVGLAWLVGNQLAAVLWPERYYYWSETPQEKERELRPSPICLWIIRARAGLVLTGLVIALLFVSLQVGMETATAEPKTATQEEVRQ